jgi:uncharacterized protein YlxW (UPF0749 family)
MRWRNIPWAIALVCLVLGIMLSTQFKVQQQVASTDQIAVKRSSDLAKQLQAAEQERDRLMSDVSDLRTKLTATGNSTSENQALTAELEQAQIFGGLIPVSGPGVSVMLNDSSIPLRPGENAANGIIHDIDVLQIVNELAASGAEAISINGQRLIGHTEIRCAGPTITINGVRTAPPLNILAVGDATTLEAAMLMNNGPVAGLKQFGLDVVVKKESKLVVPAFKGSTKLQIAVPVK